MEHTEYKIHKIIHLKPKIHENIKQWILFIVLFILLHYLSVLSERRWSIKVEKFFLIIINIDDFSVNY